MTATKCKHCGSDILWATTPKGQLTPLNATPVRIAQLMPTGDGLKIEEAHEGHTSHLATCRDILALRDKQTKGRP